MEIKNIKIVNRSRKDLGNLTSLQASIEHVGLLHPVVVDCENRLIVGERRLDVCKRSGWTEIPVTVVENLTEALALLQAERDENVERKDLAPSEAVAQAARFEGLEREAAKKRQAQAGPVEGKGKKSACGKFPQAVTGKTRDKVGAAVGMSGKTYEKAKAVVEAAEEEPGKYTELVEKMDKTGKVEGAYRTLRREKPKEKSPDFNRETQIRLGTVSPKNTQFRTSFTGENEWYTPLVYIAAARAVLGEIDLDPATSEFGQSRIQAKEFYTIQTNGLAQKWVGHIWLNPPYSQPLIAQFTEKAVTEYKLGHIEQAIILTHNYTDTAWFHSLEAIAALICFTRGRVKFEGADGSKAAPTQGSSFFYLGKNTDLFSKVFAEFGFIR